MFYYKWKERNFIQESSLRVLRHEFGTLQIEINSNQNGGFWGQGKTGVPRENNLTQSREPTNPTPMWRRIWESTTYSDQWQPEHRKPSQMKLKKMHTFRTKERQPSKSQLNCWEEARTSSHAQKVSYCWTRTAVKWIYATKDNNRNLSK